MSRPPTFTDRLRLRVCGLLVEESKVLLVKLRSPVTQQMLWMPPGGEVKFGESLKDALRREFREEVRLNIEVRSILHINELLEEPFHAVELYFEVNGTGGGQPGVGFDPELIKSSQLIQDIEWVPLAELSHCAFAPQNLIAKLNDWENRAAFAVFSG